jgi:MoaA/NifB/PqqE/SkfB family radical SAM enzyme
MKQEAPFSIQIELTEGCNLFCKFCGIRGIREKPGNYLFLSLSDAKSIAKNIRQMGWKSRIEFAMHGEPTLNPQMFEIIAKFREYLPENQLSILTNGIGIVRSPKSITKRLHRHGLNIIAIDDYKTNPFSKKIKNQVPGYNYPEDKISPHSRLHGKKHIVIYIQDITTAKSGGHSTINSHCGCATPPPTVPLNKRCAKPFREISIRWDGNVAICCNDWRGHYICGNAIEDKLSEIWNSREFNIARILLYNKDRNFIPCKWCDAISYRTGLLPDKMGKEEIRPPTKNDYKIIKQIAREDTTLAGKVLRKWEVYKPKTITDYLI